MTTYTDGYTCGKRTAHIVTVLIIALIGAILLIGEYYASAKTQHYIVLVIGILLVVVGLLSLWPILDRPVVDGREVCKDEGKSCGGWSGSKNDCNTVC